MAALISVGSPNDFSVTVKPREEFKAFGFDSLRTFAAADQVMRKAQPLPLGFTSTEDSRGLSIQQLVLTKGFDGFLKNLFNKANDIFFLAWSWDLSGQEVDLYPGVISKGEECIIPMDVGERRVFGGVGMNLFPPRPIIGGLSVRIMLWESDQSHRDFGKTIQDVASAVKVSELTNLLTLAGLVTGATTTSVAMAIEAATELAGVIGTILKSNSNDYVDYFEGFYPASEPWTHGVETYHGHATQLVLSRHS